jgi:hypothetical protein
MTQCHWREHIEFAADHRLVAVVFGRITHRLTQRHMTLLDQRFELGSNFLAGGILSFKILLQAVHVIDARTNLGNRTPIAGFRSPPFSQEISGNSRPRAPQWRWPWRLSGQCLLSVVIVRPPGRPSSPILLGFPRDRRRLWVLTLDPIRRTAGTVA